jgi:acyl-CoA thioesterase
MNEWLTGGPGVYGIELEPSWSILGSINGGFIAALLLAASDREATLSRPATQHTQFLRPVSPGPAEITVTPVRRGRRSEAIDAVLRQDGKEAVRATQLFVSDETSPEHLAIAVPDVPRPHELKPALDQLDEQQYDLILPLWREIDEHAISWIDDWDNREAGEAHHATWCQFREWPQEGLATSLGRAVVALDIFEVPAVFRAYAGPDLHHILRSLELTVNFHTSVAPGAWLLTESRSPVSQAGLAYTTANLWDEPGNLVASASQHFMWVSYG